MEDILAWSRSQSGKMSFNPEKLNLKKLVLHAIAPYEENAASKGLSVQVNIEEHLDLYADEYMLKKDEGGTGLGLVLCKEFADRHNGEILVESQKGTGSKFTLRLPK